MQSSPHIDNKGKDILILGRGPTQGLGEHSLTAEKMYAINFALTKKKKDNMKRTGFTGYVFDFSADYNYIGLDDIKNVHKYLMVKNDIV